MLFSRAEGGNGLGDFLRRAKALDAPRRARDADAGSAALEDLQHVLQHRALQRGDDAETSGKTGISPLAFEGEEIFRHELALQFSKRCCRLPCPRGRISATWI